MVSVNSQASVFSDNDLLGAVRAPLVIVDAGAGHPIRWVNEAFVAMIDQPSAQVCGRRLGEIVLDHDDESVIDGPDSTVVAIRSREEILARGSSGSSDGLSVRLERALARHEELWDPQARSAELAQIEIAVAWRAAHGVRLWTRTAGTAILDDHGSIRQWLLTVSDISDLVRLDASRALQVAAAREERAALALMAAVSDQLADMENPHSLRDIARLLESQVAWAGFYVNDEGLRYVEGVDMSNPPTGQGHRHGRRLVTSVPGRPDAIQSLLDGIEEGPVLLTGSRARLDGTASGWLATDVRQRTLLADGNAVLVLPLAGRRRVLGLLAVGLPAEGQLDEETSVLVEITARRVGLAVDNVRLYAREHQMAETLQRAMLPDQAEVDGLDIWTYYAPNSDHAQVGGDWYDVLPYGNGVVGVVVGDVVGHDVEAAAAMGQLRSVVRAYAYELSGPAPVLDRVDHLMAHMRSTRAASLVLAALSRSADGWTMQYTRAGHLPPLVVRGASTRWLDAAGGALIGFGGAPRTVATCDLLPGDIAIFFTDGLIERRGRALPVGMQRLVGVAAEASGAASAATFGEHLLSLLVDEPEDDIAIVVVRVPLVDEDPAHRTRQYRLPHDPASIARARHLVARACAAWALPDDANAALAVSEMVSNAVVHGWGPVGLRLEDTGEGLRIEVEDANPAPPRLTDGHPGRVGGFGMQVVARLGDWGWRPLRGGKIVWARMRSAPPGTPSALESSETR